MMGLAYLLTFIVYLLVSTVVIVVAVKAARKRGKSAKLWGGIAALVMYNLVFWDFLPTLAVHQFYCMKDAGFWVYKTAEEWRKENPDVVVGPVKPPEGMVLDSNGNGVMYTVEGTRLRYSSAKKWHGEHGYEEPGLTFDKVGGARGYWLNDRFAYYRNNTHPSIVSVVVSTTYVIDTLKREIMMKGVEVAARPRNPLKVWLSFELCEQSKTVMKSESIYREIQEK